MARKPTKRSGTQAAVKPKVATACAWRRQIEQKTGKKIRMLPGGWTQVQS